MKSMIHAIWVWWKGSPVIANASGCSFVIAANAVAYSMRGPTPTEMTVTPNLGAARCSSSNWRTFGGVVRIPQKGYARDGWNNLLENLQPLGTDVWAKDAVAGDISPRSGEAWHEPGAHGIADRDHNDSIPNGALDARHEANHRSRLCPARPGKCAPGGPSQSSAAKQSPGRATHRPAIPRSAPPSSAGSITATARPAVFPE